MPYGVPEWNPLNAPLGTGGRGDNLVHGTVPVEEAPQPAGDLTSESVNPTAEMTSILDGTVSLTPAVDELTAQSEIVVQADLDVSKFAAVELTGIKLPFKATPGFVAALLKGHSTIAPNGRMAGSDAAYHPAVGPDYYVY
jgi:hypothetical protein